MPILHSGDKRGDEAERQATRVGRTQNYSQLSGVPGKGVIAVAVPLLTLFTAIAAER